MRAPRSAVRLPELLARAASGVRIGAPVVALAADRGEQAGGEIGDLETEAPGEGVGLAIIVGQRRVAAEQIEEHRLGVYAQRDEPRGGVGANRAGRPHQSAISDSSAAP
jgi:hypothetical protein